MDRNLISERSELKVGLAARNPPLKEMKDLGIEAGKKGVGR